MISELKRIATSLLYKDVNESGMLKGEYKEAYNKGVMDLAEEIGRRIKQ